MNPHRFAARIDWTRPGAADMLGAWTDHPG
jgi:hypothetical protein